MKYGTDYDYPKWAEGMGLCMSFASMVWVPLYAIYYLLTQPGTLKEVSFFKSIYQFVTLFGFDEEKHIFHVIIR